MIDIGFNDIQLGDMCPYGCQLRPHIVWFGEPVYTIGEAAKIASAADIFLVVGTSMAVYPASGLIDYVPGRAEVYLVDPKEVRVQNYRKIEFIREKAGAGMQIVKERLIKNQ